MMIACEQALHLGESREVTILTGHEFGCDATNGFHWPVAFQFGLNVLPSLWYDESVSANGLLRFNVQ